jgi:hypothetical protein
LPTEGQLPEDLAPLARRQTVELRDETWTEDVEGLIRRLEGKEAVRQPRRWLPAVIGVAVLGVAGVLIWLAQAGDGGGDDDLTQCPAPDDSWTNVDVAPNATDVEQQSDGGALRYTVVDTDFLEESGGWLVVLDVRLRNESEEISGNDDHTGYGSSIFDALHVDQVSVGGPYCFGENTGDSDLAPLEEAIARVGFISSLDPTDAALMLETDGPLMIQITPAG